MFKIKNKNRNLLFYYIYINIKNSINKESYCILYSTGIDSTKLLIKLINFVGIKNIYILHINHNVKNLDINYKLLCIKLSKFLNIKTFILNMNINKNFTNEIKLRIKREKLLKIFIKKLNIKTIWTAHHKSDEKENYLIKLLINLKNFKSTKLFYKSYNFFIEKKNPYKFINKFFIKSKLNFQIKWFEDLFNLKLKLLRNIIRLNIFPIIKSLRDVAERFKALPC